MGLAAAKGLALANGLALLGIPTLDAVLSPPGAAGSGDRHAAGQAGSGILGALCPRAGGLGRTGAGQAVDRARDGQHNGASGDVRWQGVKR